MARYTINQVVMLTGIKAPTLRKWEERYGFLEAERTSTNIRYYSDDQLKKLLNIGLLTRNGYRISKIDKMSETEIHDIITNKLVGPTQENDITALMVCMLELDEYGFDRIIKQNIVNRGLLLTTLEIIYPLLGQIGILWGLDKVAPAQEHFVSNLIKKRFYVAIDLLPPPQPNAPALILFLPEGEYHEIGLLLAYYIAREKGCKVYYLGANVPLMNIPTLVDSHDMSGILTMIITPLGELQHQVLDELLAAIDLPLWISGNLNILKDDFEGKRVKIIENPYHFIECIEGLF
ncbi:MerR family transcriptional regulator [Sediminicola luteus]|uniref:MerR family transcriptional regulator n=1 Tax=Sediminicola luteus TaxID=319238 RepID=A0A2A4G4V8_9FLAO|nr:MerR family transcriptional regulator [Sediminicola luteus]PCE62765.1 MerR family transcriptional regulator [Sediminicola luteus]